MRRERRRVHRSAAGLLVTAIASALTSACASAPPPRLQRPPPPQFCAAQLARPNPVLLAVSAGGPTVNADVAFNTNRIVLARYDGCNLEIFPTAACSAQGNYTLRRSTPRAVGENRVLHNRAELIAEAPLLAAEIGSTLRVSEGVGLVLAESGFWEAGPAVVSRSTLQGDGLCVASATHFVRVAAVGAYEAHRDKVRSLEARAGLAFFGAGGGTMSGRSTFARAGDVNACFQGNFALCAAPLRYVLAPIAQYGAAPVCPPGQVPDGRGGCAEYVDPSTPFRLAIGVEGSCVDGAGACEYNLEVHVGGRLVQSIAGPQDAGWMAPAPVQHQFNAAELGSGVTVKLWERDAFEHDWLGYCTIFKSWEQLYPYVLRAHRGLTARTERMGCGGQELTFTIEPTR